MLYDPRRTTENKFILFRTVEDDPNNKFTDILKNFILQVEEFVSDNKDNTI